MTRTVRDRRQPRPSTSERDLLWLPATFIVFIAGGWVLRGARSPWSNAFLWAHYGIAWSRLGRWLRLRRASSPATAGSLRERSRPWRWAMWFTIYLVAAQLGPLAPRLSSLQVFIVAGAVIVAVEMALQAVWRRREAARRRREVADLARQF